MPDSEQYYIRLTVQLFISFTCNQLSDLYDYYILFCWSLH